ncbi:hypothetical protein K2173_015269 [Erythroxylum novogranatense]|uniref:Uncharacterized protein n=1 Tax=Erythroxylum novogranatense TaxID=1862640 RepID=A0AAV8T1H2_9ROSI|nr:hypothetical protein K2173_015269 [Erythroxylum novogranatense]
MEDLSMVAADCVVLSCCCQCLILQLIIFIFLKLPCKLARRTKEYAKKKLNSRKRDKKIEAIRDASFQDDEFVEFHEGCIKIQIEDKCPIDKHDCEGCLEDVERVMEELCHKGQFAFGSFWGRERSRSSSRDAAKDEFGLSRSSPKYVPKDEFELSRSSQRYVSKDEFELSAVKLELLEIVASLKHSN